jgi:hypothetical protein
MVKFFIIIKARDLDHAKELKERFEELYDMKVTHFVIKENE